jgi:hypothetical protein
MQPLTIFRWAWKRFEAAGRCDGRGASQYRRARAAFRRWAGAQKTQLNTVDVQLWIASWLGRDDVSPDVPPVPTA